MEWFIWRGSMRLQELARVALAAADRSDFLSSFSHFIFPYNLLIYFLIWFYSWRNCNFCPIFYRYLFHYYYFKVLIIFIYFSKANVGDDWEGRWRIVVDKVLEGLYDIDELRAICNTANQCIKKSPSDRPTMKEVVGTLQNVGNYVEPNTNQLPQPFSPIGELSPYQWSNGAFGFAARVWITLASWKLLKEKWGPMKCENLHKKVECSTSHFSCGK